MRLIDMTPSFRQAAELIIIILENGTDKGKRDAQAELRRWGDILDAAKARDEVGTK